MIAAAGAQAIEPARRLWDRHAPRHDRQIRISGRLLLPGGRSWACSQASGAVLEAALGLLDGHARHCVPGAAQSGPALADEKLRGLPGAFRRASRLHP